MPFRQPDDHGTNADGSANQMFCRFCFQQGKFTDEGITLHDKIAKNIAIAVKMGMDRRSAEKMARETLPNLSRWRQG
ncbi:MAG: zinc ribbon domain-containing protein [Saprospiraceae bacterium]|nr:zinc ribbon domain-containing protein [Saprospiraceae bacterium]